MTLLFYENGNNKTKYGERKGVTMHPNSMSRFVLPFLVWKD
ncbi:hypothetical protein C2W64_04384 [Brevibacillus laterosporus]|nr:hypothetical protein C2W64_04384 [Brevibacillus laterosporus]